MGISILAFCAIFLLVASVGLLISLRESKSQQIAAVMAAPTSKKSLTSKFQAATQSISGLVRQFENVIPKSKDETSAVQERLIRAGLREDSAVRTFYGAKVFAMGGLVVLVLVSG